MSATYKKTTLLELAFLASGAAASAYGKQQSEPLLLGFGVVLIGLGVLVGGANAIRQRRIGFFNRHGRFLSHRYTGLAAIAWGIMLGLAGLATISIGVAIAAGFTKELKELASNPGSWMIVGGTALFFTSLAMTVQRSPGDRQGSVLQSVLAVPKYGLGLLAILASVAIVGIGFWGLENPQELKRQADALKMTVIEWIKSN